MNDYCRRMLEGPTPRIYDLYTMNNDIYRYNVSAANEGVAMICTNICKYKENNSTNT